MTARFLLAALLAGLSILAALAPASAREAILDYQSRIAINTDSSLTVTEILRVRAEGRKIKRGIFRAFPTLYAGPDGGTRRVPFEVLKVLRDGRPEPYHIESASNGQVVYIGKADVRLRPGVYTYAMTYRTGRQIGYFADYDELYWNVTGSDWGLPRDRIEAVVVLPPGGRVVQQAAYTGRRGQRGQDYVVDRDPEGSVRFRTTRVLGQGEDITIAVAWPKGLVDEPTAAGRVWLVLGDNAGVVVGLVGLLLVLALHFALWSRVGRDPERGTIIPLFEPPGGLSPAAVRYVLRMGFDDKAFAAAVVDMAVKGYLAIDASKRRFTLRRKAETPDDLSSGEKKVAGYLFGWRRDSVELHNKNHAAIGGARDALKDSLKGEYGRAAFVLNRRYILPGVVMTVLTLMAMAVASPATDNAAGVIVFSVLAALAVGGFGLAGLANWKTALTPGAPFGRRLGGALFGAVMLGAPLVFVEEAGSSAVAANMLPLFGVVIVLIAANGLFLYLMQAPTAAGRRLMDAIEGFKLYLSVAEQPRLDALHPPEMTPQLFEKYLPYAMALDVETAWGERFADSLETITPDQSTYQPAWYDGRSWNPSDTGSFSGSLGGTFSGALSASATAPGSTGGSGSGGGGSAGGGGGGGGGGGW